MWATAGQERFKTITSSYYRGAAGVLAVFDVANENSFKNLENWIKEVKQFADPIAVITLVGTKSDLASQRVVSQDVAEAFAQDHGLRYIETSALDASNVETAFTQTVEGKRNDKKDCNS